MDVLLHTICVEPSRWKPRRVWKPLIELLPALAASGFHRLEIYEPHLADEGAWPEILQVLQANDQSALVLSSYVNLLDEASMLTPWLARIRRQAECFGFHGVRIFPGPGANPCDLGAVATFTRRLAEAADYLAPLEVWLETHDASFADNPEGIVKIVRDAACPNIGLLFQPTDFTHEAAQRQWELQLPLIRHVHLQNRSAGNATARLAEGRVDWDRLLRQLPERVEAAIEFVPTGICPEEEFDLAAVLAEARKEAAFVRSALIDR